MIVLAILLLVAVVYYINFRRVRRPLYELSAKLPDAGGLPVLGHTHWFIGGPEKMMKNIKELCELIDNEGGIGKLWIGPALYVVSLDPGDVQKILEDCLEKDYSYKFIRAWLGKGLFAAPVDIWKSHRKLLLPVFHNRVVEDYVVVFAEQGSVLVDRLQEQVGQPEFDVYQYITSCMLDIVFETAMGERMDVQHTPDTPYLRARRAVMEVINMRLFKAWLQPDALFNLTKYSKMQKQDIQLTHKFTDDVIQKKRAAFEKIGGVDGAQFGRKDILQLLLEKKIQFTDEQLREHIDSITIAGNDTTALVIAYVLVLLGCHEHEQNKVYEEIKNIFGNSLRSPTKEDMFKMEYLERVIKEAMRMFTVVPVIARETQHELKLSTCTLPAGVGCAVIPFIMHRSKKIWGPDVDCFNPDRFLPENNAKRHPCAYIPFSYGTRNCIGRNFGMLVMKSILANVIRSYKISSSMRVFDRLKIEILLFPVNGHLITLEKREH